MMTTEAGSLTQSEVSGARTPVQTHDAPAHSLRTRRKPRFGLWMDFWHNEAWRNALSSGQATIMSLANAYAFPYLQSGDMLMLRFATTMPGQTARWSDNWTCEPSRLKNVVGVYQACLKYGIEPMNYVAEPDTANVMRGHDTFGDLAHPFQNPAWKGVTQVMDMGQGNLKRCVPAADLRHRLAELGARVVLEPVPDNAADAALPFMVATDLHKRVISQGGSAWLDIPTDGTGPEVIMLHHEAMPNGPLESFQQLAAKCRQNSWSALYPADIFKNHNLTRAQVWG